MMNPKQVVIIGAGHGGLQVAASLRQEGYQGGVTLIGDEPGLPYQRPPLSKAYMMDGRADRLLLRPASFFERSVVRRFENLAVTRIDRASRAVETADGAHHAYDHLVLATGGVNAIPPISGLDRTGVFALRTLADAEALRARLHTMRRAVVVGGGFIGLEFASVAQGLGIDVTVVEAADRLMARVVSPEMSRIFLGAHRAAGTNVLLNSFASEVVGTGAATGVRLSDGRTIEGDIVLIATGVRPNTALAEAAGLSIDNGIAVNELLLTDDAAISAIGDCASFPAPGSGTRIRLESVQAATDHARTVARRLTGHSAPYDAVPWFWSDQGDMKLQIAGLTASADARTVLTPAEGRSVIICYGKDVLLGVETVNAPGEHMAARKLLSSGGEINRLQVERHGNDLRAVLAGEPAKKART